jgi:hypothetical protein
MQKLFKKNKKLEYNFQISYMHLQKKNYKIISGMHLQKKNIIHAFSNIKSYMHLLSGTVLCSKTVPDTYLERFCSIKPFQIVLKKKQIPLRTF